MAAQYTLWQVLPEWMTFENYHLGGFMKKTHYAFLHPTNMYHSPYVLEYWSQKHGKPFHGRMMRGARRSEGSITVCRGDSGRLAIERHGTRLVPTTTADRGLQRDGHGDGGTTADLARPGTAVSCRATPPGEGMDGGVCIAAVFMRSSYHAPAILSPEICRTAALTAKRTFDLKMANG